MLIIILLVQHVCTFLYALFHFLVFFSKSTNGKGQSQRLPIKGDESRQNNAEPVMTGVHHKSSITQGNTEDRTRGQQDPRKASERQQKENTSDKVHPDTQRTLK